MNKYIPTSLAKSVYEIDFVTLYDKGKRVILFDLDNTLATYDDITPTAKQLELNQKLKQIGYQIYIISNNHDKRVKLFTQEFVVDGYLVHARKPFTKKLAAYIDQNKLLKATIILIGDQLVTDIACANKLGLDSILVKSISRSTEKWYTKINRSREKAIIKKITKENPQMADEIKKIIDIRGTDNE